MKLPILATLLASATLISVQSAETAQPAGAAQPPAAAPAGTNAFKSIGVQEFEKLRRQNTNVVLDVRTRREFTRGHVPGSINIDVNSPDFAKRVAALDKGKTYLVLCGIGVRSAKACTQMSTLKFPHLYSLDGGITAWQTAGNKPEE